MSIADKLTAIANNVPLVFEAGEKSEHDRFWDLYQDNGKRTVCPYVFAGPGWNINTFHPKYAVALSGSTVAEGMFTYFNRVSTGNADDLFDFTPYNAMFDFSGCSRLNNTFANARIKNLYCDCSGATALASTFAAGNGGYLDNITIKVTSKTTSFQATFSSQTLIKNVFFTEDSEIAATLTLAACTKLTKESITSIVNALSASASGKSLTLSKIAVNAAFTDDEWTALANTKTNWTITLS